MEIWVLFPNLDVETSAIARRSFDAMISALDAETSSLGTATSAIARSYRRYRRGVSADCGVGITQQICNRVTNHGDMSTFSKPAANGLSVTVRPYWNSAVTDGKII